jgi:hypothetical protein
LLPFSIGENMQEQHVWIMIVTGLPALIAAIASFINVLVSASNKRKIEEIHVSINSRMDDLLKLTSESQFAKGQLEGPTQ